MCDNQVSLAYESKCVTFMGLPLGTGITVLIFIILVPLLIGSVLLYCYCRRRGQEPYKYDVDGGGGADDDNPIWSAYGMPTEGKPKKVHIAQEQNNKNNDTANRAPEKPIQRARKRNESEEAFKLLMIDTKRGTMPEPVPGGFSAAAAVDLAGGFRAPALSLAKPRRGQTFQTDATLPSDKSTSAQPDTALESSTPEGSRSGVQLEGSMSGEVTIGSGVSAAYSTEALVLPKTTGHDGFMNLKEDNADD